MSGEFAKEAWGPAARTIGEVAEQIEGGLRRTPGAALARLEEVSRSLKGLHRSAPPEDLKIA